MQSDLGVDNHGSPAWYVVQTKRHRERAAQEYLKDRGVSSYLPQIVQWPPPAVGSAIAAMFPGYLFVYCALAEEFVRISWTPGVKEFVRFGGTPAAVDSSIIDYLRGREGSDGLIRCREEIAERSEVRITRGPFRGLTAIVEQRLPARERVRVLMELLQRTTVVELPERWLARI
jgi:transcriptional antiterminator RfaH